MSLLPLFLLTPVLIAVGYCDLRYMRIPNPLVYTALVLFAFTAPFLPLADVGMRLLAATVVFLIGFGLFALRLLGGGDVKMLAALMLFIPPQSIALYGYVFSFSMALGIIAILILRRIQIAGSGHWVSMQAAGQFPMGISIAFSGIAHAWLLQSLTG